MCHKNFKVELNMNVNVFVGLNGSGKSAILTAIAVGLGSRASSTARSTTLKDLVKRGETTASIEMVLTNEGIDAYEHEVFGDEIIVIRTINGNSGASLYKMKSKSGRVISTKKDALDKMIMFFNIQVENPVLILNQDAARGFLKDCDPKKLYTLFLKATQIETIIEKLLECVKVATTAKNRNENLVRSIQHLESEINIIKQKHQRLQSVAKIRRDIVGYKNEIEWLKVIQVEKQLEEIVEQLVRKRKEIEKISDIMKNKNKYEKNLKEKIRDLGTKYCQVEESKKEKEAESEQYRRKLEEEKTKLSSLQNTHTGLLQKKKTVEDSIKTLKSEIDEMEKNPKNIANMKRENMAKIEELEKKKQDLEMLIETAKRDLNQFQGKLNIKINLN
jgi:structural maintenance of chromosomes protein 6